MKVMFAGPAMAVIMAVMMAVAAPLHAQSVRPVQFGIAGGLSVPIGNAGDSFETGYGVQGLVTVQPLGAPVGIRFDAGYNRFGQSGNANGNLKNLSANANVLLGFVTPARPGRARPYVTGGLGIHRNTYEVQSRTGSITVTRRDETTNFGLNGGLGMQFGLGGLSTLLEARYHTVLTPNQNTHFVPVVLGFMF